MIVYNDTNNSYFIFSKYRESIQIKDIYRGDSFDFPLFYFYEIVSKKLSGNLTIGSTYVISKYNEGDNFTGVGAERNEIGIMFTASSINPRWNNGTEIIEISEYEKTVTDIRMMIKDQNDEVKYYKYLGNGISLTDNSLIEIDSFIINLAQGVYNFDIELTFDDDSIKTIVKGCLHVCEDVTDNSSFTETLLSKGYAQLMTEGTDVLEMENVLFDVDGTTNKLVVFDRKISDGNLFDTSFSRITVNGDSNVRINYNASLLLDAIGNYNVQLFKNGVRISNSKAYNPSATFGFQNHIISFIDAAEKDDYYEIKIKRDFAGLVTCTVVRSVLLIEKI